jgi:hypothetical protein
MCDDRERLIGYVYEECDASERRLIDAHLSECATCRDEIGGLRAVREDLLAWSVPEHESVWRPFAPQQPASWWRQVPVWAMAAAASVMFAIGASGGIVTNAILSHRAAQVARANQPQAPTPTVATPNLTEQQQEMVASLREDLGRMVDQRFRSNRSGDLVRATNISNQGFGDLNDKYGTLSEYVSQFSRSASNDLGGLTKRVTDLESQIAFLMAQQRLQAAR